MTVSRDNIGKEILVCQLFFWWKCLLIYLKSRLETSSGFFIGKDLQFFRVFEMVTSQYIGEQSIFRIANLAISWRSFIKKD